MVALGGIGALLLLVGLLAGGAAWRLQQGPVSFDSLSERVSVALERQFGHGYDVNVEHAQLEWNGSPMLAVTGVTIRDGKGNLVVAAPHADIGFDIASLAIGQLVPRHIDFLGLAVALTIDPDGSVSVSASGSDGPEANSAVQPTDASFGPASILDALSDQLGPLGVLERAGVRDGRLRINDRRRGRTIVYDKLALSYGRAGDAEGRLALAANGPSGPWSASVGLRGRKGEERTIALDTESLAVSDLLGIAEPGAIPVSTDMPIDATLRLALGPDNAVSSFEGRITGGKAMVLFDDPDAEPMFIDRLQGEVGWDGARHAVVIRRVNVEAGDTRFRVTGTLAPPAGDGDHWKLDLASAGATLAGEGAKDKPIQIGEAKLSSRFPIGFGGVVIDKLALTGPNLGIELSGVIGRADGFEGLKLDVATTTRMPVRSVIAFWPSFVASDVRHYLVGALQDGAVQAFRYNTTMSPAVLADAIARRPVPADAVQLETTVTGGLMRPAPGMPLLSEIEAVGRVTGQSVQVNVRRAVAATGAAAPLVLTNGRYEVADTARKPTVAKVVFDAAGSAEAALAVLRSEALRPFAPATLDVANARGVVDLKASIAFPQHDNLQPSEVQAQVQGTATGVAGDNVFGKERLEGANLTLQSDRGGILVKGDGKLGGTPAQFELRQPAGGGAPEGVLTLTLDDAARARRGVKLPQVVGPVEARVTLKETAPGKATLRVELDLTRASVVDLLPGWVKTPGRPAKASFRLETDADGSTLDDFVLDGSGPVSAKGTIRVGADGNLVAARLSSLRISSGDDIRVDLERQGSSSRVSLRGSSVDARPILKALMAPGASPMASPGDFDLDIKAQAVQGLNGEAASAVDGRIAVRSGAFREFRLSGRFGSAPLSGQLAHDESGRLGIVVESANAGAFFRFFDIYRKMRGGAMLVQITGAAPQMSGSLVVNRFVLENEPALARSAPNQQSAVAFTKLKSGFSIGGGRLAIRDATMWGQSVGGTLEGYMDFNRDKADFSGTFVPAYGLNNIINSVPIVGPILGGGQHEGLFAVNFRISGRASQPTVAINPLSAVAPGFLRKFFGVMGPGEVTGSAPSQPSTSER